MSVTAEQKPLVMDGFNFCKVQMDSVSDLISFDVEPPDYMADAIEGAAGIAKSTGIAFGEYESRGLDRANALASIVQLCWFLTESQNLLDVTPTAYEGNINPDEILACLAMTAAGVSRKIGYTESELEHISKMKEDVITAYMRQEEGETKVNKIFLVAASVVNIGLSLTSGYGILRLAVSTAMSGGSAIYNFDEYLQGRQLLDAAYSMDTDAEIYGLYDTNSTLYTLIGEGCTMYTMDNIVGNWIGATSKLDNIFGGLITDVRSQVPSLGGGATAITEIDDVSAAAFKGTVGGGADEVIGAVSKGESYSNFADGMSATDRARYIQQNETKFFEEFSERARASGLNDTQINEAFDAMKVGDYEKMASYFDTSSPIDGGVFWSGNKEGAAAYANGIGGTIMEQTPGGQVFDNWRGLQGMYPEWDTGTMLDHKPLWKALSSQYANGVEGAVTYVHPIGYYGDVWLNTEYPVLEKLVDKGIVTDISEVMINEK